MNRLTEIFYEFRLERIKKSLRDNAGKLALLINSEKFEDKLRYLTAYVEQERLMSCNSYLENKLSGVQNAN